MNRLQKKCVIVSAGLHLSLLLILVVGPAFFSREEKPQTFQLIMINPDRVTDGRTTGGNANTQPPPPPPPAQQQKSNPAHSEPDPVKQEPPRIVKNTDSLAVQKKQPQISTKLVVRNRSPEKETTKTPSPQSNNTADTNKKFNETIKSIQSGLSSSTPIDINPGPGGGGPVSGNYRDLVGSIYWSAWTLPVSTERENSIVEAVVTISRDGKVISARITQPSGDSQVDASVRRTLDRVTFIAPFPEGTSDRERTYPLNFDLKMKRLEG
jgi:TonB family protein